MRWKRDAEKQAGHVELIRQLAAFRPQTQVTIREIVNTDTNKIWEFLAALIGMDCPNPLTEERVQAIFSVISRRIEILREEFI